MIEIDMVLRSLHTDCLITHIHNPLGVPATVATALSGVPVVQVALVEAHRQKVLLVVVKRRERQPQSGRNPENSPWG